MAVATGAGRESFKFEDADLDFSPDGDAMLVRYKGDDGVSRVTVFLMHTVLFWTRPGDQS